MHQTDIGRLKNEYSQLKKEHYNILSASSFGCEAAKPYCENQSRHEMKVQKPSLISPYVSGLALD